MTATEESDERSLFAVVFGALRLSEWLVLAITTGIALWAWFAYVVTQPQDFVTFLWVFGITLTAGSLIQAILVLYVRPHGTLRERIGWASIGRSLSGAWIVVVAPPLVIGVVMAIATPPSTPVASIDPEFDVYRVIFIVSLLALLFTTLGAGALFVLIVMPLGMLLASVLPARAGTRAEAPSVFTRGQQAIAGGIILSAIGFALSITAVSSSSASSTRGRMGDQFAAFLAFDGNTIAIILTWFFIAALVALVVANNRIESGRRKGRK